MMNEYVWLAMHNAVFETLEGSLYAEILGF